MQQGWLLPRTRPTYPAQQQDVARDKVAPDSFDDFDRSKAT